MRCASLLLLSAAALSTLVVVGLAGCMKVDMQMKLQSDNTIDGTMIFGISSAAAEMMGEDAASLEPGEPGRAEGGEDGPCPIELEYDGGWEYRLCRMLSALTIAAVAAYAAFAYRESRRQARGMAPLPTPPVSR